MIQYYVHVVVILCAYCEVRVTIVVVIVAIVRVTVVK